MNDELYLADQLPCYWQADRRLPALADGRCDPLDRLAADSAAGNGTRSAKQRLFDVPLSSIDVTLRAAVAYASMGWPVFPLMSGSKVPYPRSRGFLDATTDLERIRRWWAAHPDANVGGAPGPDVLDVDVRPTGTGFPALDRLAAGGQLTGVGLRVRTPSAGGHLYFTGTEHGSGALPRLYLDYKARGGYVVAAPSQVAGKAYEVVESAGFGGPFDWAAAKQLLAPPAPATGRSAGGVRPDGPGHLLRWLAGQQEGKPQPGVALGGLPGHRRRLRPGARPLRGRRRGPGSTPGRG